MVPINLIAVIVAAVLTMVLGYIWYGPLFGKMWMRLMGVTQETMKAGNKGGAMAKMYILMFIGALLMAYMLAHVLVYATAYANAPGGLDSGVMAGFWVWLGFAAPITLNYALTSNKSWKLWLINAGYYLVSLLMMGIVLAMWA
ncbi:MAG TPA: DUF1761 domain-containing protein [Candidatus Paceibacterota bacterium]|jgi:hypothetical protein|nr:DUF1761 domain-containing protein [Candidatus Paceibacterota bacterium]